MAKYWVGGTGNWSDATNHWASISGGAPNVANLPTSTDDVVFDGASNATAYTVTIDATANCRDLSFSAAPSGSGTITWAGTATMNVYGSIVLLAGMTRTFNGLVNMLSSAPATLTFNGVSPTGSGAIIFSGAGPFTFQDDLLGGAAGININSGTSLNTNGKVVNCLYFATTGSGAKTVNITNSVITVNNPGGSPWGLGLQGTVTFTSTGSTINAVFPVGNNISIAFGPYTYNNFNAAAGTIAMSGAATFANLTITGTVSKTDAHSLANNMTVTGLLTITGNSTINRVLMYSSVLGTPRTITAGSWSLTNVDFMDITAVGGPWTGTSLGDCLGNSGITFTPSATQYWRTATTGTKTWSTAGNWFLATNGGGGAGRVPLPQDMAIFDANSIGAASTTIQQDMPRFGGVNFTGVLNNPTFQWAANISCFVGDLTFVSGMTIIGAVGSLLYPGASSLNITSAGKSVFLFGVQVRSLRGGAVVLQDALSVTGDSLGLAYGTFNANGFSVTAPAVVMNQGIGTPTVLMGSGTWTLTGISGGGIWTGTSGMTITPSTSTIKITDTTSSVKAFAGGGKTYNNLWLSGTGPFSITGSNTFADYRVDPGLVVRHTAGTTQTVTTASLSGRAAAASDAAYGLLDGVAGTYFTTPDSAAASITGDIDLRAKVMMSDWTPATISHLVSKRNGSSVTVEDSYSLFLNTNGTIGFVHTNGTTQVSYVSTVVTGFTDGAIRWVRVTWAQVSGSINFYTSLDGSAWTQLGITVSGTTALLNNGNADLAVGANPGGGVQPATGKLYRAQVYNGIAGTLVADFNPSLWTSGDTFTASTGEVWTRNGNAMFSADNLTTLQGVTASTWTIAKASSGPLYNAYLAIRNGTATVGTWYAASSKDGGNNSGWLFSDVLLAASAVSTWISNAANVDWIWASSAVSSWVAPAKTAVWSITRAASSAVSTWVAPTKAISGMFHAVAQSAVGQWVSSSAAWSGSISRSAQSAVSTWVAPLKSRTLSFTAAADSAISTWVGNNLSAMIRILTPIQISVSRSAVQEIPVSLSATQEISVS